MGAHDRRGRTYFSLAPLDMVASLMTGPPFAPFPQHSKHGDYKDAQTHFQSQYVLWSGKEYVYAACLRAGQKIWVADHPVMFHQHIRRGHDPRPRRGATVRKPFLLPSAVDDILRHDAKCPDAICGDYKPLVERLA